MQHSYDPNSPPLYSLLAWDSFRQWCVGVQLYLVSDLLMKKDDTP